MANLTFTEEEWNKLASLVALKMTAGGTTSTPQPPVNSLPPSTSGGTLPPPNTPPSSTPPVTQGNLFRFDSAPSEWAKWKFHQSSEFEPLVNRMMQGGYSRGNAEQMVNNNINKWGPYTHPVGRMETLADGGHRYWIEMPDGAPQEQDVGQADTYAHNLNPNL